MARWYFCHDYELTDGVSVDKLKPSKEITYYRLEESVKGTRRNSELVREKKLKSLVFWKPRIDSFEEEGKINHVKCY